MTAILCCAPFVYANAAPVATTAGSNLTGFNPSNVNNNQWATMSNGRYDTNTTAKADFGNCNALILRCAQPKCGNGGCVDATVANGIVTGCVKSNDKCKQYGDDLISAMTAQLVASSTAKINEQQMALEQAKLQAEAAAAASNAQSEQVAQMQQQMVQMQQQMAQQQAESAKQLQDALTQQAAQSAAALESMKTAATTAAKETESGVTAYQQEAINRGISTDVLERQKITGQIMTGIEEADLKLKGIKTTLQNSFKYAGCDARGNNCAGPKRVKKWRELASGFVDDYDTAVDKIYDALITAQTVGVDLSQIYMMLNDSCNSWGQYMCQKGSIVYGGKVPMSCTQESAEAYEKRSLDCAALASKTIELPGKKIQQSDPDKYHDCMQAGAGCTPCTLLKVLVDKAEVYEGWVNADDTDSSSNTTVVACASDALNATPIFARRNKNKNGAGLIDVDTLDMWINQTEPSVLGDEENVGQYLVPYCYTPSQEDVLKKSALSKTVKGKLCVTELKSSVANSKQTADPDCPYISGTFAICDTHPYNNGDTEIQTDSTKREEIKQTIGMKISVLSQQMYKQYEYLNATLKRLKIQLEKAALTSNLEAAGAKNESSSGDGLLKGNSDKTIHLAGATNCLTVGDTDLALNCLSNNANLILSNVQSQTKNACLQLYVLVDHAQDIFQNISDKSGKAPTIPKTSCVDQGYSGKKMQKSCATEHKNKDKITDCATSMINAIRHAKEIREEKKRSSKYVELRE